MNFFHRTVGVRSTQVAWWTVRVVKQSYFALALGNCAEVMDAVTDESARIPADTLPRARACFKRSLSHSH